MIGNVSVEFGNVSHVGIGFVSRVGFDRPAGAVGLEVPVGLELPGARALDPVLEVVGLTEHGEQPSGLDAAIVVAEATTSSILSGLLRT